MYGGDVEIESRNNTILNVDASTILKREKYCNEISHEYSFVKDKQSFRYRNGKFQYKELIKKYGNQYISFESPFLNALEAASFFPINSLLEYPVFKANTKNYKLVQYKLGHCLNVEEVESNHIDYVFENIKYEVPKTFAHPDIYNVVDCVLKNNLKYIVSPKLDGIVFRIKFLSNIMYVYNFQTKRYIKLEIVVNSEYEFLAEYISNVYVIFDVCIACPFGYRLKELQKLPKSIHFNIQQFTTMNIPLKDVHLESKYKTDGLIVSFDWWQHQFKCKDISTVDLFVSPEYLCCKEGPLIKNINFKRYVNKICEFNVDGYFVRERFDKKKPNDLFTIYCSFVN